MRYLITVVIAALSLNAFGQVPNYVPSDGLVAWYPFNGNANDESGNGNNGTVVGASATIDRYGNLNSALEFLGAPVPGTNWTEVAVDNHVSVPNFNEGFQNGISISLWSEVYPTSESAFLQRRNNNNIDFSLGVNNSQQLGVHLGFINFGSTSIIVNEWTHIVLTYDEQTVQLFKNGMLIASEPSTQNINSYDDLLLIGKYIYYGGYTHHYFFNGKQDELGIWNRALTETEIQALYTAEIPISGCTDPTACNFDTEATSDDGSCIPSGCMDTYACNFNSEAECEGEACDYTCCPGPGCCDEGLQWDWELSLCQDLNPTDTNLDGCTDLNDLMDILANYGDCALVEFASCGDLLEYQGYDYETVQIGEQCWFAENLRAENYTDGTSIPLNSIENPVSGPNPNYKCFYGDDLSNVAENGMLYSWFASADSRGICPVGWHLPSLTDFEALTQEVGGVSIAGSALKAVYPTWNGNDDYGFTAIPSGYFNWVNAPYSSDPGYFFMESYAYYWSSESSGSNSAYYMILWSDQNSASLLPSNGNFAEDAMSVRCIKD